MSPLFKKHKSLTELQEEDEYLDTEVSVTRKKAMIKALGQRAGKGSWKMFSDNGKTSGISWARVWAWLKRN